MHENQMLDLMDANKAKTSHFQTVAEVHESARMDMNSIKSYSLKYLGTASTDQVTLIHTNSADGRSYAGTALGGQYICARRTSPQGDSPVSHFGPAALDPLNFLLGWILPQQGELESFFQYFARTFES